MQKVVSVVFVALVCTVSGKPKGLPNKKPQERLSYYEGPQCTGEPVSLETSDYKGADVDVGSCFMVSPTRSVKISQPDYSDCLTTKPEFVYEVQGFGSPDCKGPLLGPLIVKKESCASDESLPFSVAFKTNVTDDKYCKYMRFNSAYGKGGIVTNVFQNGNCSGEPIDKEVEVLTPEADACPGNPSDKEDVDRCDSACCPIWTEQYDDENPDSCPSFLQNKWQTNTIACLENNTIVQAIVEYIDPECKIPDNTSFINKLFKAAPSHFGQCMEATVDGASISMTYGLAEPLTEEIYCDFVRDVLPGTTQYPEPLTPEELYSRLNMRYNGSERKTETALFIAAVAGVFLVVVLVALAAWRYRKARHARYTGQATKTPAPYGAEDEASTTPSAQ